jgi:Nif-specific regulatory protein
VFTTGPESCSVRDLGSRNHTLVNGAAQESCTLAEGDEIRIGDCVFVLSNERPAVVPQSNEGTRLTQLRREDAPYGGLASSPVPVSARATHDLQTLLRLSNLLHSLRSLHTAQGPSAREAINQRLESLLLDIIPADRAMVLTPEDGNEVAEQARNSRVALWVRDASGEGKMALAAPIIVQNDVPAVLYLESSDPNKRFDEGHLPFLSAVAEMAAVAWENAALLSWLEDENRQLKDDLNLAHDMVGASSRILELQRQIAKVAPAPSSVLIVGESGTGKELVARAIHRNSPRANGPFVAVNCAALTETLVESELFGHEKGAFTGATSQKQGKLELAAGGTVFLDEIGEVPLSLQPKLLRALQQKEVERVGGTRTIRLDIRILAATNRDLEEAVKSGAFRQDLFFRLSVVKLKTPALRERPSDILPLAEHFARKSAHACGRRVIGISAEARACLQAYAWPGNVRELENAVESAVVMGSGDAILAEDLPEHVRAARPPEADAGLYASALETARRTVVLQAFEQAGYDHETAARLLGVHPNYLHKLLRTMNLRVEIKKASR